MPTSVLVLSLLVFIALLLPVGAPAAVGAALLANLALGTYPTGDTASGFHGTTCHGTCGSPAGCGR